MEIALNLYKINSPLTGEVVENRRITPDSMGVKYDARHFTVRYNGNYPYLPGQSMGILAPGTDPRTGKPHKVRLYSFSSEIGGDLHDQQTASTCVIRHFWTDEAGQEHPGACSNYMADLAVGSQVKITGPSGRHFVLPEDFVDRDLIFMAAGTGVAPFRGMLREMKKNGYRGQSFLFFGAQYAPVLLYNDEFSAYENSSIRFTYFKAVSREQENPYPTQVPTRHNRMYVQVRLYENRELFTDILAKPNSMIYICGIKGMEDGIFAILELIGQKFGYGGTFVEFLKKENRLRVEVY